MPFAVSALRRLSLGGAVFDAREQSALRAVRDTYGAVAEYRGRWRPVYAPQWLDERRLRLPNCRLTDETASTGDLLREATPPAFAFAEHQTQGRGRMGRRWLALPGASLLFSVCLPAPARTAGFSLAVGVGLWRALGGRPQLRLKWPNDLLAADGRKIGGVLIEIKRRRAVIGVGINFKVTRRLQNALNHPAAGLEEVLGRTVDKTECANLLGQAVLDAAAQFNLVGTAAFLDDAHRAHWVTAGECFSFRGGDGRRRRGVFRRFDGDGALVVVEDDGVRKYMCGEVDNVVGG